MESEASRWSRHMWRLLETIHAVVYFEPKAKEIYSRAGTKGWWMGYFASRSAPLGEVPADVVTAAFYNFHSRMVERALPDAWRFTTPDAAIAARHEVVRTAYRRLLDRRSEASLAGAQHLMADAMDAMRLEGRVLFAAYRALEVPADPVLATWHGATLFREYRGDGHNAVLLDEGLDGCEALCLAVASGTVPRAAIQPHRGWSDPEWDTALARLRDRDIVDAEGRLTTIGAALKNRIELRTDELSSEPWAHLGEEKCQKLGTLLAGAAAAIVEGGGIPFPNPMALVHDQPPGAGFVTSTTSAES